MTTKKDLLPEEAETATKINNVDYLKKELENSDNIIKKLNTEVEKMKKENEEVEKKFALLQTKANTLIAKYNATIDILILRQEK
jgi:archaellum component FlaC